MLLSLHNEANNKNPYKTIHIAENESKNKKHHLAVFCLNEEYSYQTVASAVPCASKIFKVILEKDWTFVKSLKKVPCTFFEIL